MRDRTWSEETDALTKIRPSGNHGPAIKESNHKRPFGRMISEDKERTESSSKVMKFPTRQTYPDAFKIRLFFVNNATTAARQRTYTEFDLKRNETDETKIKEQLELANQVASLLRHNLAQAVQVDDTDVYCKSFFFFRSCIIYSELLLNC